MQIDTRGPDGFTRTRLGQQLLRHKRLTTTAMFYKKWTAGVPECVTKLKD
ncbi:MAG TPA: hypothetical protein VKB49_23500 [Candidatus Sulfotelmatobacter sp.]|nr:hypothetical protein [Candidatus Sulfotelmatobacter sp.]